jgi:hypothetical protein
MLEHLVVTWIWDELHLFNIFERPVRALECVAPVAAIEKILVGIYQSWEQQLRAIVVYPEMRLIGRPSV